MRPRSREGREEDAKEKRSVSCLVALSPCRLGSETGEVPMRTLKPKSAFSLPELLAVVGIIAVLIAILLPALAKSRAEALRVRCMSNLRQLLLAEQMYVNDSKGYLTYPNWSDDRTADDIWPVGWLYQQGKVSTPPR